jgi:hypothetical protein
MIGCKEFECLVCGKCKEEPTVEAKYTADLAKPVLPEERIQTETQMADATIVYVLGYPEDNPTTKQVDEYSGLNGYHIRTIPGKRWHTPVMIGAGSGYLAVVDRFQDFDLIRITDKYAGAGIAGFDSNGFPLNSVSWESLPDICSQATPAGTQVLGLKITPRGMLVAHLSNASSYLKFDVVGRASGEIAQIMEGTKTLIKPFDTLGTLIGTPAVVNANIGPHQFHIVSLIRSEAGEVAALIIDTLQHKVVGLQGIPASPTPISATLSNNVMSVLCGDNGVASQIIRFVVNFQGGGLISGIKSGKVTPTPQEYLVEQFPKLKDFRGRTFTPDKLAAYYRIASKINESVNAGNRVIPETFDVAELPQPNESSTVLNDNRISAEAHVVSSYYTRSFSVPMHVIPVAASLGLKTIESGYGTVTELFNRKTIDNVIDRESPIFRVLHGGHYDIISEGGYTYGSKAQAYTNGMVGESLATDKDYELGTLKTIDAKAALVDAQTGLILYRHPKPAIEPIGYRVYGGDYASLDPDHTTSDLEAEIQALQDDYRRLQGEYEQTGSGAVEIEMGATLSWKSTLDTRLTALGGSGTKVKRTQASTDMETQITSQDGVERRVVGAGLSPWLYPARITPNGTPVAAFSASPECADDLWTMFLRRPTVPNQFDAWLIRKNWSRQFTDNVGIVHIFPEWAAHNTNPVQSTGNFTMLVPPVTANMLVTHPIQFSYTGQGGFYALNLPGVTMSNHDRYNEEIASLEVFNDDYQRIINAENAKPEAEQDQALLTSYTSYVNENNTRVIKLQGWLSSIPAHEFYMIPRSTLMVTFRNLDRSAGQATPYTPETMTPIDPAVALANKWQTMAIGDSGTQKRACIIEAGPAAWVGLTLSLRADSMDGVNTWLYPETRRNALGINVGAIDWQNSPNNVFGTAGGNIYSSGWRCSIFGNGAYARWGYKIRGVSTGGGDSLVTTDVATIKSMAPEDAHDILLGSMAGGIGSVYDEIFTRRLYFMSKIPLHQIVVEFWMIHSAFDVFRFGAHTIYFADTLGDSLNCPKTDPGYLAGYNIVAAACGNVTSAPDIHKLDASDPTYPQVDRTIMAGRAVFTCDNPYDALGLGYGTIWDCHVTFNLNNNVRGFDISLVPGAVEQAGGK